MSVRRNTLYNLAGSTVPMLASLVTIPIYLRTIGDARYGILSIVWLFIGYFAVFDLGLSRATSYHLARLSDRPAKERSRVFWTALALNAAFGLLGGLVLYPIAAFCFTHLFRMPAGLRGEIRGSLPWLALSVPLATISGVLNGALDGRMRFAFSNGVSLLASILTQAVPLGAALEFGPQLTHVIPAAVVARLTGMIPLFWGAVRFVPAGRPERADAAVIRDLFKYGGWVSVSNFIMPLLSTLDKMLIGILLGAADVTYYAIPDRLTGRCSVLPGAIVRALFPAMAGATAEHAHDQAKAALEIVSTALTLILAAGILVMPLFFRLWIGKDFAKIATPIGIVLAIAIYVNGLAYIPSSLLQARGRVDLTAKFHLIEIVPHVTCLYFGLRFLGLAGAAWAMLLVSALDAVLLCNAARLPVWRRLEFWISAAILLLCALSALEQPAENQRTYLIYGLNLSAMLAYAILSVPRRLALLPAVPRAKQPVP